MCELEPRPVVETFYGKIWKEVPWRMAVISSIRVAFVEGFLGPGWAGD